MGLGILRVLLNGLRQMLERGFRIALLQGPDRGVSRSIGHGGLYSPVPEKTVNAFSAPATTSFSTMTNNEELTRAVEAWRERFNRGEFFEAHEVAEERWHRAAEPEKTFLKGLIHAAVALCHYQRGNAHGARVKYRSATGYLAGYLPSYAGLDLSRLQAEMDAYFGALAATRPGDPLPTPAAPLPLARPCEPPP